MAKWTKRLAAILFLASSKACFGGYSYSVQEIPSIGAGFISAASAINDNGDVTGEAEGQAYYTLFSYRNGVSTSFGPRSSDLSATSDAIDNNGAVAATISGNQGSKATIYRGSQIQTLPDPGLGATVLDENSSGTDVGYVNVSHGYVRAAEWNDGKLKVLGDIPGLITQLTAVNSKGEAVGSTMDSNFKQSAFAVIDGKVQYLRAQSYTMSGVNDVNDNGDVVGGGTDPNSKLSYFAIIGGRAVPLPSVPGSKDSAGGEAINDADQIVGNSTDAKGNNCAILYEDGKTIDLNTEINPDLGYTLNTGVDINNRGQILVQGRDRGQFASFVLTPTAQAIPLPASVWTGLTTLPLLGIVLRRKRFAA
jgi:probable HAF family extracellular repeat protein